MTTRYIKGTVSDGKTVVWYEGEDARCPACGGWSSKDLDLILENLPPGKHTRSFTCRHCKAVVLVEAVVEVSFITKVYVSKEDLP